LSYITAGEDAKVEMIYDGDVSADATQFNFNDVGTTPLAELTMEEFGAMSGMVVIPKVIEQNQQYMFASNIKDDTIIPDLDIDKTVNYVNLKKSTVRLSTNVTGIPSQESQPDANVDKLNYLKDRNINPTIAANSYNNIFTSSLLRSLRRGEKYSYGIVYYDKYGRRSNVCKIGDIDVPKISSSNPIINTSTVLDANIYGVDITLPQPLGADGSVIDDIIGCQIVRRSSKKIYQKTLL
jgi:hypothetical protein